MADDVRVILTAVDNLSGKLEDVANRLEGLGGGFSKTQATITTWNQAIALVERAWRALVRAFEAASAIAEAGDKMRKLEMSMRAMGDSSREAEKNVEWLKKFSTETPFGLEAVTKGFLQLRAVGIDPTKGALKGVADAVAATGGSTAEFQRAILAMGQIASKGVLSLEELRGQLAESVPGAVQVLARELGITVPELFDKISKGAIDGKTAIDALTRGFDKAFGGAAASQMDTFAGAVAKLSVSWTSYLAALDKWLGVGTKMGAVINVINGYLDDQAKILADKMNPAQQRANQLVREFAESGRVLTRDVLEMDVSYRMLLAGTEDMVASNDALIRQLTEQGRQTQKVTDDSLALALALAQVGEAWEKQRQMTEGVFDYPMFTTFRMAEAWEKVAKNIDEATVALGPFQFKMKDLFGENSAVSQGIGKAAQGIADAVGQGGMAGGIAGAMMGVFQWFLGQLINAAFGGFTKKLEMIFGAIGELFDEMWDAGLKDLVEAAIEFIREFKPIFKALGMIIRGALAPVTAQMRLLTDVIKNAAHIWEQLTNVLKKLAEAINALTGNFGGSSGSGGLGGGIVGGIAGNLIGGSVGSVIGGIGGGGGFFKDVGGMVDQAAGLRIAGMPDHRLIAAHVGEQFTMPGRANPDQGRGITVNVYDSLSSNRVAEQVRLELEKLTALGKLRLA